MIPSKCEINIADKNVEKGSGEPFFMSNVERTCPANKFIELFLPQSENLKTKPIDAKGFQY